LVLEIRSNVASRRRLTLETSIVFGQNIKTHFPGIVVKRKPGAGDMTSVASNGRRASLLVEKGSVRANAGDMEVHPKRQREATTGQSVFHGRPHGPEKVISGMVLR
jgi:hypothetical protein